MTILSLWLKGLFRTTLGRMTATAIGIAMAVGLMLVLAIFVVSAGDTMTARAIANVPVDWQIELAVGADRSTVEKALTDSGVAKTIRAVEYAKVNGFSASTGGTEQVTGAGQVVGLPPDYQTAFPRQIQLLSGSGDGPLIFTQTAANLHVGLGDTVTIQRPGIGPTSVKIAGIVAMPNIDSIFQAVGVPAGMAPQSPPDNVLIVSAAQWHDLFDAQRTARPDSGRTQLHLLLDRAQLPHDPVGAYTVVREMANNVEARVAGSAAVANNLAARLDGVRGDALYAKVLFLFLGAPGIVLAVLITVAITNAGAARRRSEQALLRIRGATLGQILSKAAVEAALVGISGSALGIALGWLALGLIGTSLAGSSLPAWASIGTFFGFAIAMATVLLPASRYASHVTVSSVRTGLDQSRSRLWERLWLDVLLLLIAGIVFWRAQGAGYQIVLAAEGVAQTSVSYETFLAPLALWAGLGLLWVRLTRRSLIGAPSLLRKTLAPVAGDLAPTVGASLSRQAARLSRGVGLLALATAFAISIAIFNITYDGQARVDAELTNGADVNVTGTTADPAGARLAQIRGAQGVAAAQPMMHRYAYVGNDLQDIYGIDPQAIGEATTIANAYFVNGDAASTLKTLAATSDGVLVSEETVKDFQLQPGDTVNLRLQFAGDNQYRSVPFKFVGIPKEFPTAPKDSFLVANASYLAKVTGSGAEEVVLVRARDPHVAARNLQTLFAGDTSLKVTALGEVQSLISSSLTSVNLGALTKLELAFGLLLIAAAAGLVLGLGFAERRRTFAILTALGAKPGQIGAFLRGEGLLVTVAGLVFGLLTGFAVASMLVVMLTGVFDPPPETITIPGGYILFVILGAMAAATAVTVGFGRLHRRPDIVALKPD